MSPLRSSAGPSRQAPAAVALDLLPFVLLGIAIRMTWLHLAAGTVLFVEAGEATRVAVSVAKGQGLADAFPGMGPTAHLLPTMPLAAGAILALFGCGSAKSWALLGLWSLVQVLLSFALLHRLFGTTDLTWRTRRGGFILLCLAPVFVAQESIDFRFWEGALGVVLAATNLILLARVRRGNDVSHRFLLSCGALAAAAFFPCPPSGLAIVCCWTVFAPRHLGVAKTATLGSAALACLLLLVTPWAIRNATMMGHPILIRDNLGLEIAMANYPGALDAKDAGQAFAQRFMDIHPYTSAAARQRLRQAGGEVAYAQKLGASTGQWIERHPADFSRLCLRHLRQYFAPDGFEFIGFGAKAERAFLLGVINCLGLAGLSIGLVKRRRGFDVLGLYVAITAIPYCIVQPVPRYTYLIYGVLAFLAVDMLAQCVVVLRKILPDRRDIGRGSPFLQ